MKKANYILLPALVGTMVLGSAGTAFAAQGAQNGRGQGQANRNGAQVSTGRADNDRPTRPLNHRVGEITAINGTMFTVKLTSPDYIEKTLSVDVSKATFEKITFDATATSTKPTPVSQTLSDLEVGETIGIKIDGNVTEDMTSVVASLVTEIEGDKQERPVAQNGKRNASSTKPFLREGKRIVGEVLSINGTTLVVKAMNEKEYTIDADSAEIRNGTTTVSFSDINTGERIAVRGEVTDTSIDASMILLGVPEAPANAKASATGKERSFLGKVGSFFGKFFGKKVE